MTTETKVQKRWAARKWGWILVLLSVVTIGFFAWSLGNFITTQVSFFYELDRVPQRSRILGLHGNYTLAVMIPILLSHFIWVVIAISLWRALKKQQQSQNESTPVIKLDQAFGEKFGSPSESDTAKSTDIEDQ